MRIPEDELPRAGPWPAGVNNVAAEGRLPTDENGRPVALREANNVDLTAEGHAKRRQGSESCYVGTLAHSLWGHDELSFGLFVDAGVLHTFDPGEIVEPLGITVGNLPLSYALVGDRVFFSNAHACGMLAVLDRSVHAWGAPDTPVLPAVEPLDGYGLPAGLYQVAVTVSDELGRESGAERAGQVQVRDGQGLLLQGLPTSGAINVYLSGANDQVLRLALRVPAGTASCLLTAEAEGVRLATHLLDPMPPGQLTRIHNGRMWVADGRTLRWSPSLRYGMTDLAHNVIRFDARIDLLEPVGAGTQGVGMFISAGKRTYWLSGADPSNFSPVDAHAAGAVPGTEARVPGQAIGMPDDADYTIWLSRRGTYVMGLPGGSVQALNAGRAATPDAERGASVFAERDGLKQVVTTLKGPRSQGLAVTDRAAAHVIHADS